MDEASVLLYLRYNPGRLIARAESLDHRDAHEIVAAGWRVMMFDAGGRMCRVAIARDGGRAFGSAAVLDDMERRGLIQAGRYWQTYQLTDAGRAAADIITGDNIDD
ncbi:MAG TPA: hypothetical protein DDW89_09065 [Gammaproteobacteria bacterium]|nr:hypothetical protein [Gammaproteobacteria bacterium]